MNPASRRLDPLTSLRFFAALAVMLSHLRILAEADNPLRHIANTVFFEGYSGVTFFFVLSGFVISLTYHRALLEGTLSVRRYLLLRVARIYPLHVITALPFIVAALHFRGVEIVPLALANLALVQSWIPSQPAYFSFNTVAWTLSDEMFFYAMFAFLPALSTRAILWAIALATAGLTGLAVGAIGYGLMDMLTSHWVFLAMPLSRLLDFLVGVVLYRLYAARAPGQAESGEGAGAWTMAEIASCAALLVAMYVFSRFAFPQILRYQLLYLPFMAVLVHVFAVGRGALSRLLSARWLVFLGEASFALYMIHAPIVNFSRRFLGPLLTPLELAGVSLALAIAAAAAVHVMIERPIHDALRRRILAGG